MCFYFTSVYIVSFPLSHGLGELSDLYTPLYYKVSKGEFSNFRRIMTRETSRGVSFLNTVQCKIEFLHIRSIIKV